MGSAAGVAELADATDSKSVARKGVWVRSPPPAIVSGKTSVLMGLDWGMKGYLEGVASN